ncbi:MAG: hypothetical protein ACR2MX_17670, partial [Cyclobacteriaceae bacterium]
MEDYYISIDQLLTSLWPDQEIDLPDHQLLDQIRVKPAVINYDTNKGATFSTGIILGQGLEFAIPKLDNIFISVGGSNTAYELDGSVYPNPGFTVGPIPIKISLRNDLLLPTKKISDQNGVDVYVRDPDIDFVSLQIDNSKVGYSSEQGLVIFSQATFSLPVLLVNGTNLFLGLEEVSIIASDSQFNPVVLNLGFDLDFRGVYARSVTLYWLPEIQINDIDVPGLRMDFEDLAIGNQGVSLDLALSWEVAYDASGNFNVEETELLGYLFNEDWPIAIGAASGSIRRNIPESFSVKTYLRVPFFEAIFSAYFGLSYRSEEDGTASYKTFLNVVKESNDPIVISHFDDQMTFTLDQFQASGFLSDSGFAIEGQTAFSIDIFGFELEVGSAQLSYVHLEKSDKFSFTLADVVLGDLGQVSEAKLFIEADRNEQGDFQFNKIEIGANYSWHDLQGLIPQDLQDVVNLPDDGSIEALISWVEVDENAATAMNVIVDLKTEVSHLDSLWDFIPDNYKPEVRSVKSMFRLTYASSEAFNTGSNGTPENNTDLQIELSALMEVKLPEVANLNLPGFDLIKIETGDEDGFITAVFKANYQTDTESEDSFSAGLTIENPFSLDINLPGTDSELPFIHTSVNKVGFQFQTKDDGSEEMEIGGKLFCEGDFNFRPLAPLNFPFA